MKNKDETAEMNLRESGETNKYINNIAKAEKIMQRAAKGGIDWISHDSRREINALMTGLTTQVTQLKPQITEYVDDDGQIIRHQNNLNQLHHKL